jgi:deazaflavin-dependent oxidoreductase (nitroreductase family)
MKDIFIKWFMAFNTLLIRISGGKLGSKLGAQNILILHTIGRKTGLNRAIPIVYFNFNGRYLIVGSNWGKDKQANWYLNLKNDPQARLEINRKIISANSYEAEGEEYDHLWKFTTERNPQYIGYQKMTNRHIPIMILEKAD